MLLISVAAAGLVSRGSQLLGYAALAAIGVLTEQTAQVLAHDAPLSAYVQPALLSVGYFATALITSQLAQRVITNERVARQRGIELANQLRISELVIQDVQDGVLVVDTNGLVRQHNRQVESLLGRAVPELEQIESYSPELAAALVAWRSGRGASPQVLALYDPGRTVRVRFVAAGLRDATVTVIYLEDMSKHEEQARQLAGCARPAHREHRARDPQPPRLGVACGRAARRGESRSGARAADAHHPRQRATARPHGERRARAQPARPRSGRADPPGRLRADIRRGVRPERGACRPTASPWSSPRTWWSTATVST
ncbi:MAG: hypothetical protein M5U08_16400 [Burkholderiales bacterium]|nr:hypothetical protein [Burkholderiales bacterium]